jgi:hypothetical protein
VRVQLVISWSAAWLANNRPKNCADFRARGSNHSASRQPPLPQRARSNKPAVLNRTSSAVLLLSCRCFGALRSPRPRRGSDEQASGRPSMAAG